ncbi:portal protein [Mycobacterium phage Cracklewink]|nr:portal protein [Mycobacterium phage Cracklewink]
MSLLTRLFGDGDDFEQRLSFSSTRIPSPAEDSIMWGASPKSNNAMSSAAFYACVTLLADVISQLPVGAYVKGTKGGRKQVDSELLDPDRSPYPETTWFEWVWMLMESAAITGNAFSYVTKRDGTPTAKHEEGLPTALMPVHPDVLSVKFEERLDKVKWPEPVWRVGGQKVNYDDLVHVKRYPIAGQPLSMSPIQKAAQSIGLSLAAEKYGYNYFKDSANPSSVLETDQTLDAEQVKGVMQRWISSHGGKRRPAVLSGGFKWRPIAIAPNEAQFLETRQFQRSEVAMWFRIPPHMIGDTTKSTSWGTGIEQQSIGFVKFTLGPWLVCIEQMLSTCLPKGQFAKFNIDALLRGDVKSRWEAYRIGRDSGVYSVNEIREKEDLEPVGPEGDIRLQPMNFVPLGTDPADLKDQPAEDNPDDDSSAPTDDPDNPDNDPDSPSDDEDEDDQEDD